MSDDEDMETQKAWVPLSQRKEWSDVTPIPPKEDGPPVVRIIYSPRCENKKELDFKIQINQVVSSMLMFCSP